MAKQLSTGVRATMFLASFALIGCAPPAVTKHDPSTAASQPGLREQSMTERSARADRGSTSSSSLEAHRRGGIPSTSSASPLREIYYEFDRYDLRPDARETLKANATWLKANPSVLVEIEGHADERGTAEYNLALAAKRAQSAKDFLITLGISAGRLSTISYGEELPVCREQTEECWQRNRRARFPTQAARPSS